MYGSATPLLVQHPMLMAHDAAMAYMGLGDVRCLPIKTQAFSEHAPFMGRAWSYPSGFSSMLDCGIRAMDLRLGLCSNHSSVCMHHSVGWLRDQTFESELPSIVRWCGENPDELVLLKIVPDNDGDSPSQTLIDLINAALDRFRITSIRNVGHGCWNGTSSWTLGEARSRAQSVTSGGQLLVAWKYDRGDTGQPAPNSCVQDNFVSSLGYNPSKDKESWDSLWAYANKTIKKQFGGDPSSGEAWLQELQLIWQESPTLEHIDLPTDKLFPYSILKVDHYTDIKAQILQKLPMLQAQGSIGLLKINDVCVRGPDIATMIGTKVTDAQRQRCNLMCSDFMELANIELACTKSTVQHDNSIEFPDASKVTFSPASVSITPGQPWGGISSSGTTLVVSAGRSASTRPAGKFASGLTPKNILGWTGNAVPDALNFIIAGTANFVVGGIAYTCHDFRIAQGHRRWSNTWFLASSRCSNQEGRLRCECGLTFAVGRNVHSFRLQVNAAERYVSKYYEVVM